MRVGENWTRGPVLASAPAQALSGMAEVPGDKSISHRAVILGALAEGETRISGLLEGDDVLHTAQAVRLLGAEVERLSPGEWRIRGAKWKRPAEAIDCGNSGTGARLLMGAVAGFPIQATFVGDQSLSNRPMDRVLDPLRAMGARAARGNLPVTIEGGGLKGIRFVNERASAQVKSAILLAGLRAQGEVEIVEPAPTRDHTENMLRAFGCEVDSAHGFARLGDRRALAGTRIAVPGDPSSAAFPLVAALITMGSRVVIRDVMVNPLRSGLFSTLIEMGADLTIARERSQGGEQLADLIVSGSSLFGVEVPAKRAPSMIDEYPVLAIAAAFARGRTVMRGLSELRVKETDRVAAMVEGLRSCGVDAWAEGDSLIVEGRGGPVPGGAEVRAFDDHRIAMSFLTMGVGAQNPITVDSADMIDTSFPPFVALMRSIGARIG